MENRMLDTAKGRCPLCFFKDAPRSGKSHLENDVPKIQTRPPPGPKFSTPPKTQQKPTKRGKATLKLKTTQNFTPTRAIFVFLNSKYFPPKWAIPFLKKKRGAPPILFLIRARCFPKFVVPPTAPAHKVCYTLL